MRRLLVLSMLILAGAWSAGSANFISTTVSCPSSGTQRLASVSTKASLIVAQSPLLPTPNTGRIHFGDSSVTTSGGVYILPGDPYSFPPEGNSQVYDLRQIYFACTVNTDVLTLNYVQ